MGKFEGINRAYSTGEIPKTPQELQREYDSYMSAWSSRKKRYWEIYKKQFAKKQTSGEYRRLFLALVSEEVQKR